MLKCSWCNEPTERTMNVFGPVGCCSQRCEDALCELLDGVPLDEVRQTYPLGVKKEETMSESDQPNNPCDPDIYENGNVIAIMTGPSTAIEAIVVRVRQLTNVRIDWHYVGGRGVVKVLGSEADQELAFKTLTMNRVSMQGFGAFEGK